MRMSYSKRFPTNTTIKFIKAPAPLQKLVHGVDGISGFQLYVCVTVKLYFMYLCYVIWKENTKVLHTVGGYGPVFRWVG